MSGSIGTHHAAALGGATVLPFTGMGTLETVMLAAAGFTLLMAGIALKRALPKMRFGQRSV